jgi:hypothetical protein
MSFYLLFKTLAHIVYCAKHIHKAVFFCNVTRYICLYNAKKDFHYGMYIKKIGLLYVYVYVYATLYKFSRNVKLSAYTVAYLLVSAHAVCVHVCVNISRYSILEYKARLLAIPRPPPLSPTLVYSLCPPPPYWWLIS